MMWWKQIALLKQQLNALQTELEKEQGKATRLAGFISRVQNFGISPTGQIPRREFAETLLESVHALLRCRARCYFRRRILQYSGSLLPEAGRGFRRKFSGGLRVRAGEGILGKQRRLKIVDKRRRALQRSFFAAPYLILPLASQARCIGLLSRQAERRKVSRRKRASSRPSLPCRHRSCWKIMTCMKSWSAARTSGAVAHARD